MNPYRLLGVHRQSSDEEIYAAYKAAARSSHPDAGGRAEDFIPVAAAWAVLGDRNKRSQWLRAALARYKLCHGCKGAGALYRQRGLTQRVWQGCATCHGAGVIIHE